MGLKLQTNHVTHNMGAILTNNPNDVCNGVFQTVVGLNTCSFCQFFICAFGTIMS